MATGEDFLGSDDVEAMSMAKRLLAHSEVSRVELWEQSRKLGELMTGEP